ncbi:MAG: SusC/RagA family TonB-linked outer membrane protein [Phocaeicola sp.]
MKKRLIMSLTLLCMFVVVVVAQVSKVTGVVISAEDNEPIIGASVLVKGTTLGTITDVEGGYTITNIPADSNTLTISYVGMKSQEVSIKSGLQRIVLQSDSEMIDEIVVTAMGISKEKKALGYAVQDVKAEELTKAANTSLAGALQGKVSGVDITPSSGMPGASSKITIRGSRSFTGDNTPLYVIDGMPVSSTSDISTGNSVTGSDFASRSLDIDPNDIESVNILKGQAASALYGMRASNGVIIITTKSGKSAKKGKPQISINSNVSFDVVSTLPNYQTTFAQGVNGVFNPTSSLSWGPRISELANDATYGGNTDNEYTKEFGKKEGMYYVRQRALAGLDPWATPQAYNNIENFFQTGITWSNSANVAQAFDKGNYSFSLGNTTQDGIVPNTGMNRYNAKMAADAKLHDNWSTGFTGNFVTSKLNKQTSANNGIVATVYGAPASYDLAGIPSHVAGDPYKQNTYRATGGFDAAYWAIENNEFIERSQRFYGNTYLKYDTKFNTDKHNLSVKYQLGVDSYTTDYTDSWGYGHSNKTGEIEHYGYTVLEMNSLLTAMYSWNINEKLVFDALLGNEFVNTQRKYYQSYGANFNIPGWNHVDNATTLIASESLRKKRTVGNFASLSLAYNNMLYFNATGRNDIVSSMPRNNRSFFYPSVSLGFIFTELEMLKNEVLTFGKIRASYAEVGQAGTYYDTFYRTPTYGGGFYSGTPIQYPINGTTAFTQSTTVYDPNLKPQNTRSYELGLDLTFFNGLFNLNYTYSRQNVTDQIFSVPLAGSTGATSLVTNGGAIHTNAHEFTLGMTPIDNRNFKWDFAFNFSKIDNYVDKLADGVESIMLGGLVTPQIRASVGDKFPVIYGTSFLRNDNGDIVVDANGMPQMGDERVIGTVAPNFTLGFNTTFDIYKFQISATLDWKNGGQMYCGTMNTLNFYGTTEKSASFRQMESFLFERDAVKKLADGTYTTNDIAIPGSMAYNYFDKMSSINEGAISDSDFLKLRELSISYPVWTKNGINVNLNAFARNLILWSAIEGLDPESSQGNNNMGGGFERFSLPGSSSYGFGINVKF